MLQSRNIVGSKENEQEKHERFYSFDKNLTDEKFIDKYFMYMNDSEFFNTDFKPEDKERAGTVMEKILEETASRLGVDLEIAKSVVATALVKKQDDIAKKQEMSIFVNSTETEMFMNMDLVDIDSIVYNVLFGCYLSKRTGRELMFELTDMNETACFILSKNGLRLMSIIMTLKSVPSERKGQIACTVGPGAFRDLFISPDVDGDIFEKLDGFDLETIFELCENSMDLSGKQIQDIFVKYLNGVNYSCHDIFDIETCLMGLGQDLNDYRPKIADKDETAEQSKEILCLLAAESYIRDRWFIKTSNYGANCTIVSCFDTGENSFAYSGWGKPEGAIIRTGKAIIIAPYREKHYADFTYPDIEFNFGICGDVFELYVSGLTMRTRPVQGLEAILKIDYEKLIADIGEVLGKVAIDRKNLDNFFDLETGL